MSKKILVIGAGVAQEDAIKRAKNLGYYVLASDGSSEAVGLRVAHEGRVIDVKDGEQNLAWAQKEKIDGVISYASDITLPTVFAVREALGLPGLGRVPMEISLDKSKQRERFKQAGLPQPRFEVIDNLQSMTGVAEDIGFPLVVKPIDNSGSRGVTLVYETGQLPSAYLAAVKNSKKKKVIVEEFIEEIACSKPVRRATDHGSLKPVSINITILK